MLKEKEIEALAHTEDVCMTLSRLLRDNLKRCHEDDGSKLDNVELNKILEAGERMKHALWVMKSGLKLAKQRMKQFNKTDCPPFSKSDAI